MQKREVLRHTMHLYRMIAVCLARKENVVLATVISRSGSGPREAGASMLITQGGTIMGTVGGGHLEAKTLESAEAVLRNRRPLCHTFSLTDRQAAEGGMICGGRVEVLIDCLDGGEPSCLTIFERLLKTQEKDHPCWLVRSIRPAGSGDAVQTGLGLIDEDDFASGSLDISSMDRELLKKERHRTESVLITYGDIHYFIQPVDHPETVFIFGAGHVGQELATLCHLVGFQTIVIDDRKEFASAERFPSADRIVLTSSYQNPFYELDIDKSSYLVIVTRGHVHDRDVLSCALKTPAKYIGMIASRRKRDVIYRSLLDEGFSAKDLARVHSPIGLDIGARTPAEIAVSIAAELISVRAGQKKQKTGGNT